MLEEQKIEDLFFNVEGIHDEGERIRGLSIEHIKGDERLLSNLNMLFHSMDIIHQVAIKHPDMSQDELTLQLLGIRLFNAATVSFNSLVSGYYQKALDGVRDILETSFLLDYFSIDRSQIKTWRECINEERVSLFRPKKIRETLDGRDGLKERKREQLYSTLSELATHPSYKGFNLLKAEQTGLFTVGPFVNLNLLGIVLYEMTRLQCHAAAHFIGLIETTSDEINVQKLLFRAEGKKWGATSQS